MLRFYISCALSALLALNVTAGSRKGSHRSKEAVSAAYSSVKPQVLPPTDVTATGFTANWEPVSGAEGYAVLVYNRSEAPSDGVYAVLYENFNLVSAGSWVEPEWVDEYYIDLSRDPYNYTYGPDWTVAGYASFAGGMVGGVIYSPYIDLTNDGGTFTVNICVQGYSGSEYVVTSCGATEESESFILTETGANEFSATFTNGCHDTFLRFVDNGFPDDDGTHADCFTYLDEVTVTQQLKAGDQVLQLVDLNEEIDAPDTSCPFEPLRFTYDENTFYYDVVAAFRDYDDPDDPYSYEQWYSDYSDLQEVKLDKPAPDDPDDPDDPEPDGIRSAGTSAEVFATGAQGAIHLVLPQPQHVSVYGLDGRCVASRLIGSGSVDLPVAAGVYIISTESGRTAKIAVK